MSDQDQAATVVKVSVLKRVSNTISNLLAVVDETSGLGVDTVALARKEVKILDGMQQVRVFETTKEIKEAATAAGMPDDQVKLLLSL